MSYEESRKELIERNKELWFVQHIKEHLEEGQEVICKICSKNVAQISEERMIKIEEELDALHAKGEQ